MIHQPDPSDPSSAAEPSVEASEPVRAGAPTTSTDIATKPWQYRVRELLSRAAALSAEHGVELDQFMHGASVAYFDARPGLREHLEDLRLREQLAELRKSGRLGRA